MITIWILAVIFCPMALLLLLKFYKNTLNVLEVIIAGFSIFVGAISIGIIQSGGIHQFIQALH